MSESNWLLSSIYWCICLASLDPLYLYLYL